MIIIIVMWSFDQNREADAQAIVAQREFKLKLNFFAGYVVFLRTLPWLLRKLGVSDASQGREEL